METKKMKSIRNLRRRNTIKIKIASIDIKTSIKIKIVIKIKRATKTHQKNQSVPMTQIPRMKRKMIPLRKKLVSRQKKPAMKMMQMNQKTKKKTYGSQ